MKLKPTQLVITAIIIIVVVLAAVFGIRKMNSNTGQRQAVFLTNGQVYFGFVKNDGQQIVSLTDVYYLQAADTTGSVQPADTKNATTNSQVSLVKLGNELHGPDSLMKINRDHILFIENMRPDSKVNDAIKNYKQ